MVYWLAQFVLIHNGDKMSIDLLHDEIDGTSHVILDPVNEFTDNINGLYFVNMNTDKSVRLLLSRPDDLSETPVEFVNQHPHIVIVDNTAQSFCLSPRPIIDISCDGASSHVALELEESKKYKIVLGGQVIAADAKPSQFEAIFATYGMRVNYLAKPVIFTCASYVDTKRFDIPMIVNDINSGYHLTIKDETGLTVLSNDVNYNQTTIGTGTNYAITGIVSTSVIAANAYLLSINIVGINGVAINPKWKVALTPLDSKSAIITPEQYATYGYIPAPAAKLPTMLDNKAYWCIDIGTEW